MKFCTYSRLELRPKVNISASSGESRGKTPPELDNTEDLLKGASVKQDQGKNSPFLWRSQSSQNIDVVWQTLVYILSRIRKKEEEEEEEEKSIFSQNSIEMFCSTGTTANLWECRTGWNSILAKETGSFIMELICQILVQGSVKNIIYLNFVRSRCRHASRGIRRCRTCDCDVSMGLRNRCWKGRGKKWRQQGAEWRQQEAVSAWQSCWDFSTSRHTSGKLQIVIMCLKKLEFYMCAPGTPPASPKSKKWAADCYITFRQILFLWHKFLDLLYYIRKLPPDVLYKQMNCQFDTLSICDFSPRDSGPMVLHYASW